MIKIKPIKGQPKETKVRAKYVHELSDQEIEAITLFDRKAYQKTYMREYMRGWRAKKAKIEKSKQV